MLLCYTWPMKKTPGNKVDVESKGASSTLDSIIKTHPVVFVTRDMERALGRQPGNGYSIITNGTPYSRAVALLFPENVQIIESKDGGRLDTVDILELKEVKERINKNKENVLVFKNTRRIESICKNNGWKLLNPSADLAEKIESKISQEAWLRSKSLDSYLPTHFICEIKDVAQKLKFSEKDKNKYVLQFDHGHTGESTIFLEKLEDVDQLTKKFPNRTCKVTDYINGPMFTVNCVAGEFPAVGNISYQITGLEPFTDKNATTIGNDWALPGTILNEENLEQIRELAKKIGKAMSDDGWSGLFGIDVIFDINKNQLYLIEINARQCASTTYESILQAMFKRLDEAAYQDKITMFDLHLLASNGVKNDYAPIYVNDGAQIIQRATKEFISIKTSERNSMIEKLREGNLGVIEYPANEPNGADVLRIQSAFGIMAGHEKFNDRGTFIKNILDKNQA